MTKNHFATLGLKLGAGEEDVKKAYRSLAKQWHPDKNRNPGAEEKFKEIGSAYEYLQSKDRRELLARELSQKAKPSTKPPTQTTAQSKSSGTHPSSTGQPSSSKPSYNWNYKGTEKTSPPPSTSSQSSARTGPSKENQSPGSQGKKTKAPHWSDSFHKKPRGGKSQQEAAGSQSRADWKPWGNDWQDDAEDIPSAPHFSEAFSSFRTFVDQLGGHFGAAFFFGTDDTDFGLFGEPGSLRGGRGARPAQGRGKPRQAPRNVASEHGYTGGLDNDLLFEPGAGKQESAKTAKCPICKKMVTPAGLARHERHCGRFDAPSDTDEDELPPFRGKVYSSDYDDDYYHDDAEDDFMGPFGKPKDGDWRNTHEDVLNKIRRDRKMYAANLKRQSTEEIGCKWCGRTFNPMALERHLPVCKEHVLRYGRPMNPTAAHGPPPESKFARSRKYSESVPKPHAGGASQKFPGREADEGEDRYSASSSSFSSSPPPPTMGARFSRQPGNMRPNARPSPPKDAPHRPSAADASKNTSPTNGVGRGKPPAASSSGTKQPSKSNSSAGGQSGGQGKKFQGTGFKVGGANTHASRQTNGRGTKQ